MSDRQSTHILSFSMQCKVVLLAAASMIYGFGSIAQKPPAYFFTDNSEYYFTDREMDSLIYRVCDSIFAEAGVPKKSFEQKYTQLKILITTSSQKEIVRSFKMAEGWFTEMKPAAGSAVFLKNRQAYITRLARSLRETFYFNKQLSVYTDIRGGDRILFYNSTVRIQSNGRLMVTDKIKVYNGDGQWNPYYPELSDGNDRNNDIQRGLVRAFPLYYINSYGFFQNTTMDVKAVSRNGTPEPWHTESWDNGVLLYTGSKDVFLDQGVIDYEITYESDRQVKWLGDYDELYWNVTGSSWPFRMDSAQCTIMLPPHAGLFSNRCYTGPQGDTATDCRYTVFQVGDTTAIRFEANSAITPGTGFTIASSWTKGFIAKRSLQSEAVYYIWNNKAVFFLPLATLLAGLICYFFWRRYGRDPEKGTIYPQYEPPGGFSPAGLGFIYFQQHKRQLTVATLVDAAVRKVIRIDVDKSGLVFKHNKYTIRAGETKSKPPISHYDDYYRHVKELVNTSIYKGKYNKDLADLDKAIKADCETKYKNKDGKRKAGYRGFFAVNSRYMVVPAFICLIAGIWAVTGGLFRAFEMGNIWPLAYFIGGLIICIVVMRYFSRLLKAYTPEGRKLMDHIEGFRMFLATADVPRFDMLAAPERSLDLFEQYLPHAIALGCEIEWGEKFEDIIKTASIDGTIVSTGFAHHVVSHQHHFSSSFTSSFSGAISSASTPPSSSSGGGSSFGGGSSGGGGGGGGGGGW